VNAREALLEMLRERHARYAALAAKDDNPVSLFDGWRDATAQALKDVEYWLPQIEADAFLKGVAA